MLLYAQWLVQHPEAELTAAKGEKAKRSHHPTSLERQAKATTFARRRIDRRLITLLERREDFRSYFEKMRADAQFLARELLQADVAENVEARRIGLRKAVDRKVDDQGNVTYGDNVDHAAVERYTHPFVDLAFPKKIEREQQAPRITIHLSPDQHKALLAKPDDILDVEWEEIPREQITDGRRYDDDD
jgi:hypothetical protein